MGLPLVTERLELRAFEPDDLEALHAIYGDPEVTRFMPAYPTLEHTRRALDIHVCEARAGNPAFWALPEVLALVRPANAASINVLEKIGMQRVGTREAYGAEHLVYAARPAA